MTGSEIRRLFLEFFSARDHLELPSAPLVPQGDPTTLFISAGMQPLQPYYQGVVEPPAPRLVSCQKCFRTPDLDEVGKTDRHGTFFEMLGNFAPTGAYFKETAIPLAWELLTGGFGLPKDRLRVTTHPTDEEARQIWRSTTDVRPQWIFELEDNWWGLASGLGPMGPDSEIWWDRGREFGCGQPDCPPDHCARFVEVWNLVFPQFDGQPDGSRPPLPKPAVDTGMGLERITAVIQGVSSVFETDLYTPVMGWAEAGAATLNRLSQRLLTDHLRGMTFVLADGVVPGKEGRGYVLRRLIRRSVLHGRRVGLREPLGRGVDVVIDLMRDHYPELAARRENIQQVLAGEIAAFEQTLEAGSKLFEKVALPGGISGEDAFRLHDTFGFPFELTRELAEERGIAVDEAGFRAAMEAQRERSRTIVKHSWADLKSLPRSEFRGYAELETRARVVLIRRSGATAESAVEGDEVEVFLDRTPFYGEAGGQIGDTGRLDGPDGSVRVDDTQRPSEGVVAHLGVVATGLIRGGDEVSARVDAPRRRAIARHHSATHLLHKALREVLGEAAAQRGSWVGPEHTTFDFALNRAVTAEELDRVWRRVNEEVRAALPFAESIKPYREAVQMGAMHLFEEKYGAEVRVVCFGDWTCELCGGTHVASSADVGPVVILGESSIGAGLRRIDLAAGEAAERLVAGRLARLGELGRTLGVPPDDVPGRVAELRAELRAAEKQVKRLEDDLRVAKVRGQATGDVAPGRGDLIHEVVEAKDADDLRAYADRYMESIKSGVVALVSQDMYVIKVANRPGLDANQLKAAFGGRGGGRPELVQGKLTVPADEAFRKLEELVG